MKTVRRLLYRDIVASVVFVAAAFLSLFYFIDFVDDLEDVGKGGRSVWHVALGAAWEIPGHLYELLPITVLIGTIYSLARMAQSSEFTILRTGGLGPGRALGLLALLGLSFSVITFVVGDFVAPASEREAVRLQARFGGMKFAGSGAWLKDRRDAAEGERSISVNVAAAGPDGALEGVRIFEFDAQGRLRERINARRATVDADGLWMLTDVERTVWPGEGGTGIDDRSPPVRTERVARMPWRSTLAADVVASAVLPLATMTTRDLWRYSRHLSLQEQAAQRYEIGFWRKALYPLACMVMVALALPFAYLHARSGGVSLKVFGGIMLGISFVLLNNLAGHIGVLRDWTPWVAAATPGLIYLLMSLAAFSWLVRYR